MTSKVLLFFILPNILFSQSFTFKEKGLSTLSQEEIATTPGSHFNLIQAISTLPGIISTNGLGFMYTRGGNSHETRFVLDGMIIPYPLRWKSPHFGNFFILKGEHAKPQSLETNGFSAEYGQALSGLVIFRSDEMVDTALFQMKINLTGLSAFIRHPMSKYNTLNFSASYTNTFLYYQFADLFSSTNAMWREDPAYYDVFFSNVFRYGKNGKIKLYSFSQGDQLGYEYTFPSEPKALYSSESFLLLVNLVWEDKLAENMQFKGNIFYTFRDLERNYSPDTLRFSSKEVSHLPSLKFVANYNYITELNFIIGIEVNSEMYLRLVQNKDLHNNYFNFRAPLSFFSEIKGDISDLIKYRLGVRLSYEIKGSYFYYEPRALISFYLPKTNFSFFTSLNLNQQHTNLNLTNEEILLLTDINKIPEKASIPEKCMLFSAGFKYHTLTSLYQVEGFYKNYINLPILNSNNQVEAIGQGYSWGVDFLGKQIFFGVVSGWISYSFIVSNRAMSSSNIQTVGPTSYDIRHTANLVGQADYGAWTFGISYRFNSGRNYIKHSSKVHTPIYHNLSTFMKYKLKLKDQNLLLFYLSASNLFRNDNIQDEVFSSSFQETSAIRESVLSGVYFGIEFSI